MTNATELSLYEYSNCPFCTRVRDFLAGLGETVESRDVSANQDHLEELERATGSRTVPCLRIRGADGSVQWMHESADIIRYLKGHFAHS